VEIKGALTNRIQRDAPFQSPVVLVNLLDGNLGIARNSGMQKQKVGPQSFKRRFFNLAPPLGPDPVVPTLKTVVPAKYDRILVLPTDGQIEFPVFYVENILGVNVVILGGNHLQGLGGRGSTQRPPPWGQPKKLNLPPEYTTWGPIATFATYLGRPSLMFGTTVQPPEKSMCSGALYVKFILSMIRVVEVASKSGGTTQATNSMRVPVKSHTFCSATTPLSSWFNTNKSERNTARILAKSTLLSIVLLHSAGHDPRLEAQPPDTGDCFRG
jgi:hypothetical protein